MRYLVIIFILLFLGCSSSTKNEIIVITDEWVCNQEDSDAIELINHDSLQLVLVNEHPRYVKELKQLLLISKIQLRLISSMHGDGYCFKGTMDSVLAVKFGLKFQENIKREADSMFFKMNRDSIFPEKHLDKRPTLSSGMNTNGQIEIIRRLNEKNLPIDSIKLISNIVSAPYFVVKFIVTKEGKSYGAEIIERYSTSEYEILEKIIIHEINNLSGWKPGQIRSEDVSSIIDVAIAINNNHKNLRND